MMPIRTVLIDDEPISLKNLQAMLGSLCPDLEIVGTAMNAEEALEQLLLVKPELVFLDIELGGSSGFDVLKRFGTRPFEVIFVTAHNQFGIDAVKVNALDYILKPISKSELLLAVERAREKIAAQREVQAKNQSDKPQRLALPTMEGLHFVGHAEILYVEAEGRYSRFVLENRSRLLVSRNLGDYEHLLSDKGFVRIHHHYLVNLAHVEKYIRGRGGYVIMKNGQHLDVSTRKKDDLFDHL